MDLVQRSNVEGAILKMLEVNMGLKGDERLLVVTDVPTLEQWKTADQPFVVLMTQRALLAKVMADVAQERMAGVDVRFLPFPSTERNAVEPPPVVTEAMEGADVVCIISSFSLSHTDAREEACRAGARIASMPFFIPEMFYPGGPMDADYGEIKQLTERVASALTSAHQAHVTCPKGTDITFSMEGRTGQVDAGLYTEPGMWGNLPAGEAYCAPIEGTGEGVIQISPGWHADLIDPIRMVFTKGELVELRGGGTVGRELREILRPGDEAEPYKSRRNLAEFGVGTNPNASRVDIILEAEKIKGTVHLAVGDNSHMGGLVNTDYHQDFVIPKPSFTLDDQLAMRDGEFILYDR
jgi:aminopeptidase